jgi:peroxiredoxin
MVELGQLERHHEDFARRHTRVVVASLEDREKAEKTQQQFPHLLVLSDEQRGLADAAAVIHEHSAPGGGDTAAPTTFLIDRSGVVRWFFRPDRHIERLPAADVLDAVDRHLPASR